MPQPLPTSGILLLLAVPRTARLSRFSYTGAAAIRHRAAMAIASLSQPSSSEGPAVHWSSSSTAAAVLLAADRKPLPPSC